MSVLPVFSSAHPVCPKCDRPVDHTRFCSADRLSGPIVPDCKVSGAGEHLHRMCQCGYFWVELCADSREPSSVEVERVTLGVAAERRVGASASQPAPVSRGGAEELRQRPVAARPAGAPGGIAGGATEEEREDIVTLASDESFPASDPPAY